MEKNLSICQTFRKKFKGVSFLRNYGTASVVGRVKKLWYCIGGGEGKETMVLCQWWGLKKLWCCIGGEGGKETMVLHWWGGG